MTLVTIALAIALIFGVITHVRALKPLPNTAPEQDQQAQGLAILIFVGVILWALITWLFMINAADHTDGLKILSQIGCVVIAWLILTSLASRGLKPWFMASSAIVVSIRAYELSESSQSYKASAIFGIVTLLLAIGWLVQALRSHNAQKQAAARLKQNEASRYQAACEAGCTHSEPAVPVITDAQPPTNTVDLNKRQL